MFRSIAGEDAADLSSVNLAGAAQRLLLDAGMSQMQIDALKSKLGM